MGIIVETFKEIKCGIGTRPLVFGLVNYFDAKRKIFFPFEIDYLLEVTYLIPSTNAK